MCEGKWSEKEGHQRERYQGSAETSACSTQSSTLCENQRKGIWAVGAHFLWIHGMTSVTKIKDLSPDHTYIHTCIHTYTRNLNKVWTLINNTASGPGWWGSRDWILAFEPRIADLIPSLGHMPGLWARSPVEGLWEVITHRRYSPSLFPSLPLRIK